MSVFKKDLIHRQQPPLLTAALPSFLQLFAPYTKLVKSVAGIRAALLSLIVMETEGGFSTGSTPSPPDVDLLMVMMATKMSPSMSTPSFRR